jgi:mannose-1-phosphate guanylyltransferase/phosphomannomutase
MIMAAGVGSRLEPLTINVPKPMVPVVNKPAMEHIIALLRRHGITEVVANLWYLPRHIEGYFGNGCDFGIKLRYSREARLRGTAGGMLAAKDLLLKDDGWDSRGATEKGPASGTFVLMAGDAVTGANLTRLIEFHKSRNALATIGLKRVDDVSGFGIVVTDGDGRILRFQEKPRPCQADSDLANTMIYVFEPEVFEYIPPHGTPDFGRDIFPLLVREGVPFYGLALDEYWCDIGTLAKYHASHRDILLGKAGLALPGEEVMQGVFVCEGTELHRDAALCPPVCIGGHVTIGKHATIGPYSVIGNRCEIGEGAIVRGSIVWNNTKVGQGANLVDCVVGSDCYLAAGASLGEGVVLSDECFVEEDSIIKRNVRIDPGRIVKRKVDNR